MLDLADHDIKDELNLCNDFIEEVKNSGGCVLVHCNAGVSRSAAVAIYYVMKFKKFSYDEAYSSVKTKRESIRPNDGFITQLKQMQYASKEK